MKVALNLNSNIKVLPQTGAMRQEQGQTQTNPAGTAAKPLGCDTFSFTGLFDNSKNPKHVAKEAEKSYEKKGWFDGDKKAYVGTKFKYNAKYRQKKYEERNLQHIQAGFITHAIVAQAEKEAAIELGYTTQAEITALAKENLSKGKLLEGIGTDNQKMAMIRYEKLIAPHTNEPEFIKLVQKKMKDMINQKVLVEKKEGGTTDMFSFLYSHRGRYNACHVKAETTQDFHGFFLPMVTKQMSIFSKDVVLPFRKDVYPMLRDAMMDQYENPRDGYELYSYDYDGDWVAHTLAPKGRYEQSKYNYPVQDAQDSETRAYIRAFLKATPDVPGRTVLMPKEEQIKSSSSDDDSSNSDDKIEGHMSWIDFI